MTPDAATPRSLGPVIDILIALASQHGELAEIIDGCTNDDWERPTRCEGWDVAAVLLHLAQTDELATASAHGEFDRHRHGFLGNRGRRTVSVDAAAAAQVDADRAVGGDAIRQRWRCGRRRDTTTVARRVAGNARRVRRSRSSPAHHMDLRPILAADPGYDTTLGILDPDIASALGIELQPTDRLRHIARLAWRTLPYAFHKADVEMNGPVALDLIGPNGDPWRFDPDAPALTTIRGSAAEFCEVAARRVDPDATDLVGDGPDAAAVLRLVRTYAQ